MSLLRRLSIQKKLLFSMGLCLLLFMAISSFLSVRMSSDYVRERVVGQELPALEFEKALRENWGL